jgi:hypothetical protein
MKNPLMKTTLGILVMGLMATGAQAGWTRDGHGQQQANQQSKAYSQQVHARQDRQLERIQTGLRSGQITRGEFRELMHEQHTIRTMERHFRADGGIDAREFRRLELALDRASRNIRTERHDHQARHAYGQPHWFN